MVKKSLIVVAVLVPVMVGAVHAWSSIRHSNSYFDSGTCESEESLDAEQPVSGWAQILAVESTESLIVKVDNKGTFSKLHASATSVCREGHFISVDDRSVRFKIANITANKRVPSDAVRQFRGDLGKALVGKKVSFECYAHAPNGELECSISAGRSDLGLYTISAGLALYDASRYESPSFEKQYRMAQDLAANTRSKLSAAMD